jgi:hypothetical protein
MTNREERDQTVLELQAVAAARAGSREQAARHAEAADMPGPRAVTTTEPPREREHLGMPGPARRSGLPRWGRILVAGIAAVAIAVLTFVVSNAISATYKASAQLRVTVNGTNGLGQDAVLGANQLAAQLVQLAPTDAVLAHPAAQLGMSTSRLRSALSIGTVAQQNIVEVSATGSSKAQAEQRAGVVTSGLLAYLAGDARNQLRTYRSSVDEVIAGMDNQLQRLSRTTGKLAPAQLGVIQGEAGGIAGQAEALRGQLAQHQATSVPTVQEIQGATTASKTTPQPLLYAIVALLVAGFVAAQLLTLSERRARGR